MKLFPFILFFEKQLSSNSFVGLFFCLNCWLIAGKEDLKTLQQFKFEKVNFDLKREKITSLHKELSTLNKSQMSSFDVHFHLKLKPKIKWE